MREWLGIVCAAGVVFGLGAADEKVSLTFVDLQPFGNHALNDAVAKFEGNHLKDVPRGEKTFEGTKFTVGDKLVQVRGVNGTEQPEKVEGIKVDAKAEKLHFLHATEFGEGQSEMEDGKEIGAYVLHYTDGTDARLPIVYGEDVRDWWDWKEKKEVKRGKEAWRGKNDASEQNKREIRLFSQARENPHPEKTIKTIDLVSGTTECAPFVVAITLENKDVPR